MAEQNLGPRDFFAKEDAIADLGLIACPGAEELCKLVDSHLVRWAREVGNTDVDTFIIPSDCPRFQSGDAKGLVKASTRGDDLYIFVDPGNYSVTYQLFGYENHLSPDDHFQNLMRLIQAVAGRAHRISVIMPSLYGGRQHRRVSRESLDCAFALQQLRDVGVKNIITFDAGLCSYPTAFLDSLNCFIYSFTSRSRPGPCGGSGGPPGRGGSWRG